MELITLSLVGTAAMFLGHLYGVVKSRLSAFT